MGQSPKHVSTSNDSVTTRVLDLFLGRYFLWTVSAVLLCSIVAVVWEVHDMSHSLVRKTALRDAMSYNEAVAEFRTLYTSEVVARVKLQGIKVSHDYEQHAGAIPLPATFSKLLGDRLGRSESQCETRLYSDYPFPWRQQEAAQDDFERDALRALKRNPDQPFYRFETVNGAPYLRYATADLMRQSCVQCHNTHPESPKTDWKTGDVRGVLAVRMPLTNAIAYTNSELRETLWFLGFAGGAVLFVCGLTMHRLRKKTLHAQQSTEELTRNSNALSFAKNQLEQAHDNLRARADDLDRSRRAALNLMSDMRTARDAAEAATQAKSEFLANMSHEIRTPMTAILGFNDILLDSVSDPDDIDAARTVKENGQFLINLINDILDLSKIEAGKMELERVACSPQEIIAEVTSLMGVRADAKGLPLSVRFEGRIPGSIQTDPTRLRQILINTVGNAIKFTETGSVEIVTRLIDVPGDEPKLQFDVIDTGIGIAPEQVEKLFLAFTQTDGSTTRQFGGTGLGLTISKRLVELMGGEISVSSTLGQGSTFSITISTGPFDWTGTTHHTPETINDVPHALLPDATASSLKDVRVLFAEDGPDNQRLISFLLRKAGADVTLADNGETACDLATAALVEDRPFDVILMDMQMPVLDGYEATHRLREADYTRPIIALTAHAMASDRQKCLDAGCDSYLTKPIDSNALIESIRTHARRLPSQSSGLAPTATGMNSK